MDGRRKNLFPVEAARVAGLLVALALVAPSARAAQVIDRTVERGYLLTMPTTEGSAFRKVGLAVVLPEEGVSAEKEKKNWTDGAEQFGLALLNLEVDYNEIHNETHIDALYKRITGLIKEVLASQPSIEKDQVFIAGTSRGGMAAIALALQHPGVFKGVGVASGALLAMGSEDISANAKGQHFIFAQGMRDKQIPVAYLNKTLRRLSKDGAVIQTHARRTLGHRLEPSDYAVIAKWMAYRMGRRSWPSPTLSR